MDSKWAATIFLSTIVISIVFSFLSAKLLDGAGYLPAFIVLAVFIFIGIIFDVLGVAVTAGDKKHFHAMASRKTPGAIEALRLLKNAEKVSNICNDVVGDICGIISGTTSAVLVLRLTLSFSLSELPLQLFLSGLVAGLTVGGKALGKSFAINKSTAIVHYASKLLYHVKRFKRYFLKIFRIKDTRGNSSR